tara:strand:- start:1243 stop:1884 length:642 start_codon:yes stop_codon:yes gene_type:complete
MSYLADVQMPNKEEEEDQGQGAREAAGETIPQEDEELNDDEQVFLDEEDTDPMPVVVAKEKYLAEDIFKAKAPPKKKVKIVDKVEEMREAIIPKIAPVKAKRKMSEKQLEALARGRASRAKKKAPAPPPAQQQEPAPAPAPAAAPAGQYYSKDDLQEMVFQGVQKYDLQRKERKAQKQKLTAKATHEKKVFSDINNALERTVPTSDPWANCFT